MMLIITIKIEAHLTFILLQINNVVLTEFPCRISKSQKKMFVSYETTFLRRSHSSTQLQANIVKMEYLKASRLVATTAWFNQNETVFLRTQPKMSVDTRVRVFYRLCIESKNAQKRKTGVSVKPSGLYFTAITTNHWNVRISSFINDLWIYRQMQIHILLCRSTNYA